MMIKTLKNLSAHANHSHNSYCFEELQQCGFAPASAATNVKGFIFAYIKGNIVQDIERAMTLLSKRVEGLFDPVSMTIVALVGRGYVPDANANIVNHE